MSMNAPIAQRSPSISRALAVATLALAFWPAPPRVAAQDPAPKTVREHIREYWEKLIARMESSSRAAGEEYHKLRDEAAQASGPAREKLAAKMEALSKKWAGARARLAASLETHMHALGEEARELEEKAGKASGPAREKLAGEREKLHAEWAAARAKLEDTLASNMKASRDELEHLRAHAAEATEETRARLGPRIERLKAEFHKDREKLAAHLETDLERTREEMEKLRGATSDAARHTRETLSKKSHELAARLKELAGEKEPDVAK